MFESDLKPVTLNQQALNDLAVGCAFLGSGGGGDPHYALLELSILIEKKGPDFHIDLIPASKLSDKDLVAPCGWLGAPTVSLEKLPSGTEALAGLEMLEEIMGREVNAVFPVEIGGSNGLAPLILAVKTGLPVVDCDGMGRAFPESQMVIFNVHGVSASPAVLTDAKGNSFVIGAVDNITEERVARAAAVSLGGICHLFEYVQSGKQVKDHAIHGTLSIAVEIGRSIREAKEKGADPFEALLDVMRSFPHYGAAGILFDGKIMDVKRETKQGFSVGHLLIEDFAGKNQMEIEFQNENLIARVGDKIYATVPDIISVMDRETAHTITTEQIKYGQRVKVVGVSAPSVLRTPEALEIMGPKAFGMSDRYRSIEALNGWKGSNDAQ
ncbi:DUF917 domain-containing protein [Kordiimonas pumila]|uniref:DUF917 domain-containing protein n=1 Tax=Kordiimonas pumila TaxID=2161677 RepID=A0ABV7D843_9PROT|nr:DUF917 domain-containing protein [Kordiimonas pumila]